MDYAALKSEIEADPALSALWPADPAGIATAINVRIEATATHARVTKTTIYGTIGFAKGLGLVGVLKAQAASPDPATALKYSEVLDLVRPEGGGLDISHPDSVAFVDGLQAAGVIAAGDAAALKALGTEQRPLWQRLAGRPLDYADVVRAMEAQ